MGAPFDEPTLQAVEEAVPPARPGPEEVLDGLPRPEPGAAHDGRPVHRRTGGSLGRAALRVWHVRHVFGPIFAKEMRVAARRPRSYVLRTAYFALLAITITMAWLGAAETVDLSSARGAMAIGTFAPILLAACGYFQLIGLTLIGPILTSGAISEERTHRTLNVLLMTPVTPWQIVVGKLMSRTFQMLLLAALTLPALAMVQVYGGVETRDLVATVAICLSSGLFAAALGMLISTFSDRVYRTILNSYFILVGLYLVLPVLLVWGLWQMSGFQPGTWGVGLVAAINPFVSLYLLDVEMLTPGALRMVGIWGWQGWLWVPVTTVHVLGTLVLAVLATLRVRYMVRRGASSAYQLGSALRQALGPARSAPQPGNGQAVALSGGRVDQALSASTGGAADGSLDELRSAEIATAVATAAVPQAPAPGAAPAPPRWPLRWSRSAERPSRTVGDNPVLWRELHRRLLGRSAWWWVGVVVLLLVLLSLYGMAAVEDGLEDESFHALLTGLYLLLVLLEAGVYAPPTITSEKESSTWPILLSTTLSGRSVVTSKAVGVMRRLIPISLLLVGHVVLFTLVGVLHPIAMVHTLVISVGFMSFLIALGLWFSLRMRRTTGAVVATILTGFTLWAILPVLVGIFWVLFLNDDGGLQAMVAINPLFWMGTAAAGAAEAIGSASYSGRPAYDLPVGRSVGMGEFTGWLVVVCGAYTAVAAGLLAHSIARFNRVSGRTS